MDFLLEVVHLNGGLSVFFLELFELVCKTTIFFFVAVVMLLDLVQLF